MKRTEIPQDQSALSGHVKELCYAVDEKGQYATGLSEGWEVKTNALDVAWEDIRKRVDEAAAKVRSGEASPILFFMELRLMDPAIVAAYTGYWKWTVKRHLRPAVFARLNEKQLKKYADLFEVSVEELKTMKQDAGKI